MDRYTSRGVSAKKEDVHNAIKKMDKGLYPGAFCKIIEDVIGNNPEYCNIMHADGAGTKSSLAYIYYKETGDISVFHGIVMDAIVMNLDDLLCIGCDNNFILSNTIGRNSKKIPGEIIHTIINAYQEITEWFSKQGINIVLTGGETADVGDLVKTLIVDSTITARMKRQDVITQDKIKPGQVIVGFSSSGQATYEKNFNSGIGSNGLTSARHDLFHKIYQEKYPESFNTDIEDKYCYSGPYKLTDSIPGLPYSIGKAVLSPTRTYAPLMKNIFAEYRNEIAGMIHCTGGGQTKCLNFGNNIHYIKDNLMETPVIFKLIQEASKTDKKEMYQVFNMGHRLEIIIDNNFANNIIAIAKDFNINAQVIGYLEKSKKNRLTIKTNNNIIEY